MLSGARIGLVDVAELGFTLISSLAGQAVKTVVSRACSAICRMAC